MRIMIIEDDKNLREHMQQVLENLPVMHHEIIWLLSHKFSTLQKQNLDELELLVLDRDVLGNDNTWAWLADQKAHGIRLPKTILVSGKSDVESFADYEQQLAATAVCKQPEGQFLGNLQKAVEKLLIPAAKVKDIRDQLIANYNQCMLNKDCTIVGICESMMDVQRKLRQYAVKTLPVLILGKTGTGKELVARQIHERSGREGKFVPLVTDEFPKDMLASELFGVEASHATGVKEFEGLLKSADGGTLFLDEIAEMPPEAQVKFLRFLETKEIRKIGSRTGEKVNVRIVAATNKNLREEVDAGRFREDLYFRLAGAEITVPSLAQRSEQDIKLLLEHFVREVETEECRELGTYRIAEPLFDAISNARYPWPGNVREFRHCILSALANGDDGSGRPMIDEHSLPHHILYPVATKADQTTRWLQKLAEQEPQPVNYSRIEELQDELAFLFLRPIYATSKSWRELCDKCKMEKASFVKPSDMNPRMKKIYARVTGNLGDPQIGKHDGTDAVDITTNV